MGTKLLVLLAMLAYAAAGPVRVTTEQTNTCATTCKPSTKFSYTPGQTLIYDYVVQSESSVDGASQDRAAVSISAQAHIEVLDQCDMVLLLKDIKIYESSQDQKSLVLSPSSDKLAQMLSNTPLRFSLQDGVVTDLCPSSQEDPWALNIKRGLLSALQNSMDFNTQKSQTVREADVTGQCDTHYQVTSEGYWGSETTIKRRKDLNDCTDRHQYLGSLQTTRYQADSGMQSLPLIQSDHECQQVISRGIVQSSVCSEKHLFRPFSAHNGGAVTTVMQKLTFSSSRDTVSTRKDLIDSRAQMTFDHGYTIRDSSEARERVENLLTELCTMSIRGIEPEVPRVFSQLVASIGKLDDQDTRDIYRQLKRQKICHNNNDRVKRFYLDALPMAGSSQAVDLMKDLMISGDVSGLQVDFWLASMAFIPEPTYDMVQAAQELLQSDALKLKAMLPISSMIHNYCQKRSCNDGSISDIISVFDNIIGYRCSVNDGNIKTVLTTLKAIGNTGQREGADILGRCLGGRVPVEVRVAAAQAYRRMPCDVQKRPLADVMEDSNEDSEIRIAAYQQLMYCPSPALLTQIQVIMEKEPEDSQVGAFMYTHLSNLKETSSPLKQDIKQMLKDLQLRNAFYLNPLKSSRNYEKSAFLKIINSGAQAESNVIFSGSSFVPRSVSANLTVDVLGHSINLLEVGARLEGMEYLIETLQDDFFASGKGKSVKSKLDDLKGSGYARIFGNELLYNRFQGIQSLESGKTFNLLDFLIRLSKEHDYTFSHSMQFLDSTMTIPTVTGLPLTLAVNGSVSVEVKAMGKMDLRKLSKSPRSLELEGEIRPSGAVNVDGVMSVDALLTRTGLKMTSYLHSSMALKGRVELDRGRTLHVQLDTPDDKIDVLDVSTKFFILYNGAEREQEMIKDNRQDFQQCSGQIFSKITGMEMCGQLQFPNASMQSVGPYFPLTGPTRFSVVLHKRDSHTGYKLLAKRVENKRSSIAQISFDTPGSSVVRALFFDMMLDYPQREAEISFGSPWKKTSVKGSLVNEKGMKSLTGSLVIDDDLTYALTSEVKIDDAKDKELTVLTPRLEIRRPGADSITVMGEAKMDSRWRSLSTDLTLSGAAKRPVQLQASLANSQVEKRVTTSIKYGKMKWAAEAGIDYNIKTGKSLQVRPLVLLATDKKEMLRLEGSTDYRANKMLKSDHTLTIPDVLDNPINLKCDITKRGSSKKSRFNVNARIKSQLFTGTVRGPINVGNTLSTALDITYNVPKTGKDKISVKGKLLNKSNAVLKKYIVSSSVEFKNNPDWNVQTNVDLELKKKRSQGSVLLKLGKNPKDKRQHVFVSASLGRKINSWAEADIDYTMKALAPRLDMDYALNAKHSHTPSSLDTQMTFKYDKGQAVKAAVNLQDKTKKEINMNGGASLSFADQSYEVGTTLRQKGKQVTHNLDVKTHEGPLLTLASMYKPAKGDTHKVTSDLHIDGQAPVKMTTTVGLKWKNFELESQILHGKDTYSLDAQSKISKGPRGKWIVSASYPSREVKLSLTGGMQKTKADVDLDFAWNKGRDNDAKIVLSMEASHKSTPSIVNSGAKMDLSSPFTEKIKASFNFNDDNKRYAVDSKVSVGPKSNSYSSSLEVQKPISPRRLQVSWSGESPLAGLKRVKASVDHTLSPARVYTVLKASKGKDNFQMTVKGNDNSNGVNNDFSGVINMESDIRGLKNVTLSLAHKDDGTKYTCSGNIWMNRDRYAAELDMTHIRQGWNIENNGKVQIVSPSQNVATEWQHSSSKDGVKTSFDSEWGRDKKLEVSIAATKDLSTPDKTINTVVTIQSPWKVVRDFKLAINNEFSSRHCKHAAVFTHNSKKQASSDLKYRLEKSVFSGDFKLTSPFMDDISVQAKSEFGSYPVSSHVEVNVGRDKDFVADTSYSYTDELNMEGNVRLVTPFQDARTITLSGSTSSDGVDVVGKANLDYGIRQNFDAVVTFRPQTFALGRIVLHTPISLFSSLDTGYHISGTENDFDAAADFTLEPHVDKYSATLNWQLDEGLSGKAKINTPIPELQYMQVIFNSQEKGSGRKSHIELDYYPRQTYTLTNFYTTQLPIVFSLTAETPIQDYHNVGVSVNHDYDDTSVQTHGELRYHSDQVIDSTFILNWGHNVDGSLVVKTPFTHFEESRVSVRHDGKLRDFTSHAEMAIMGETMTADAQFKYGYTTSGSFVIASSLENFEKIEATFNKRGPVDKFKSFASFVYGDEKIQGTLSHKLTSRVLETAVTFNSPFHKAIKSSVDMSNKDGNMQATIQGQYGPKKMESVNSVQIDGSDFTASSSVNYNFDGDSQTIIATASKKGDVNDFEAAAAFSSPFTEDIQLDIVHFAAFPHTMKSRVSGSAGDDYSFKSENNFENRDPKFAVSTLNTYRYAGPLQEVSVSISKEGDINDVTVSATGKLLEQEITVNGMLKTANGINGKLDITTPFDGFERTGLVLDHSPTKRGFRQNGKITYMSDQSIQHEVSLSHSGLEDIDLDASITSPIRHLERNVLKVNHECKKSRKQCSGSIEWESSELGNHVLTYKRAGDLDQVILDVTLDRDGEQMEGHIEWVPLTHGYKHTVQLKGLLKEFSSSVEVEKTDERITSKAAMSLSPYSFDFEGDGLLSYADPEINGKLRYSWPEIQDTALFLSAKKTGPLNDVKVELKAGKNTDQAQAVVSYKNAADEVSGQISIQTPFDNLNDIGGSFRHSGNLNRFTSEGSIKYLDNEEISSKVTFYRYQWKRLEATGKLTTPFSGFKNTQVEYRHAGSSDSFTCSSFVEYGDSEKISTDLRASLSPKYEVALTVKTPFKDYRKIKADAKVETLANTHTASSSLEIGRDQLFAIEGSVDMDSEPMTMSGKLSTSLDQLREVEVSGSHQGQIDDFSTTLVFNSPQTDVIKGNANLKYTTIFDVAGAVSVTSEIAGMEDLRVEVKNADLSSSKSSHILVHWAPLRQISLDGSYTLKDFWYNKELQAEISLATPFDQVRTATLHVEHEQKDQTYVPKVEFSVNGDSIVDMEGELTVSDNPSASILSRAPWSSQLTSSLTRSGDQVETDIFLNFNRNKNDQNLRLQTTTKNVWDDQHADIDYLIKIIHPSRTWSSGVTLSQQDQKLTSEGFLAWDERVDRRLFYSLELADNSKYLAKAYEGTARLGGPGRTLETTGSYSHSRQTRSVDGSFSWDAERDMSKQVGFNAKITSGDLTKTDLTVRMPAISKEVHIDHEMSMNQGRTVWDSKTEVSYSRDSSRTLTLTSSLKDISHFYDSGKNYSLAVSISHPHTDLDVSILSHIGASQDRYSAAMDTVYLTSRRTRVNMGLRGEIDHLKQQIDLQLDSPIKKVRVHGEVESTQPYILTLTNTYDDQNVIQSRLNVDPKKPGFEFSTNYDLDNPGKKLMLTAGYVNDTALKADVYHVQNGSPVTDGQLALRLNTSTLLHSRLTWRPQIVQEIQDYIQNKRFSFAERLDQQLVITQDAIGQEITDKYAAIAEELKSELSPILDVVESELGRVSQQMARARKILTRMYRRNDYHMQEFGGYVQEVMEAIKAYHEAYLRMYVTALDIARTRLDSLTTFDIRQQFDALVEDLFSQLEASLTFGMEQIDSVVSIAEDYLLAWTEQAQNKLQDLQNHESVQRVHKRVQKLGQDYKWIIGFMGKKASQLSVPEQYTSAIYNARDLVNGHLVELMGSGPVRKVKEAANEVYQQGAWAYRYWQVESKVQEQINNIVRLLKDLVREKVEEITHKVQFLRKSNITVYDPENGEIQVDLVLPIELQSLREVPDFQAWVIDTTNSIDSYMPDRDTISWYYDNYAPWVSNETTPKDDLMNQFEKYTPAKRARKIKRNPRRFRQ